MILYSWFCRQHYLEKLYIIKCVKPTYRGMLSFQKIWRDDGMSGCPKNQITLQSNVPLHHAENWFWKSYSTLLEMPVQMELAVVNAVVQQESKLTQHIVCTKSRLAKRNLTILWLELVAGHMAINLATNMQTAIYAHPMHMHCWLNSKRNYCQFVFNRVSKIPQHKDVKWHHVPTGENPADLRSSSKNNQCPWVIQKSDPKTKFFRQTRNPMPNRKWSEVCLPWDIFGKLLDTHILQKGLRICVWIQLFIQNRPTKRLAD